MPSRERADAPWMTSLPRVASHRGPIPELLLLHAACAAPLLALAVWFGLVDSPAFDEGRCSSCGVEGYVIAAHVAAAVWLAAVVAFAAAARRDERDGIRAPGPVTLRALAAVGAFMAAWWPGPCCSRFRRRSPWWRRCC